MKIQSLYFSNGNRYNINENCDHQFNPGTNTINPQPFTVDEQDVTPLPSPTNEIAPAITLLTKQKQYLA